MNLISKVIAILSLGFFFLNQTNHCVFNLIKHGDIQGVLQWLDDEPDLDIRNELGQTVLIYAVIEKQHDIVMMLRAAGIDKSACDIYGKNAYDYAVEVEEKEAAILREQQKRTLCIVGAFFAVVVGLIIYEKYYGNLSNSAYVPDAYVRPCNCHASYNSIPCSVLPVVSIKDLVK